MAPDFRRDHHLERLEMLTDGVYAIALTLLALDLRLPDNAAHQSGAELLASLLGVWPKLLSFITSFTVVAMFWATNHRMFHYIVRFDGSLRWLTLLQLGCIAVVPFPTAVLGDHLNDAVAEELYFGTLALNLLVAGMSWWYISWNRRLIGVDPSDRLVKVYRNLFLAFFLAFVVLLALVPIGLNRMVNPLILGYFLAFVIIALGLLDRDDSPNPVTLPGDEAIETVNVQGSHDVE